MPDGHLLDSTVIFSSLPPDVRTLLSENATLRDVPRGATIFNQGDSSTSLFVVEHGRIAIAIASAAGSSRETVIAVLEDGELFGELPLFDDAPRSADARALIDSKVLEFDYQAVREVFNKYPDMLWLVVRLIVERLRMTDESLADTMFLDVPARTAKRLLELSGNQTNFILTLTQEELSAMVGASRERVNKAIALFLKLEWIGLEGRNNYTIRNRAALIARAAGKG